MDTKKPNMKFYKNFKGKKFTDNPKGKVKLENGTIASINLNIMDDKGKKLRFQDLTRQDIIELSIAAIKEFNDAFESGFNIEMMSNTKS